MFSWLRGAAVTGTGAATASVLLDADRAAAGTLIYPATQDGDALQVGGNNRNTSLPTSLTGPASAGPMLKVNNTAVVPSVALCAESATGASLLLVDSGVPMPPPTGTWPAGSFVVNAGHVWYCYAAGVGAGSKWLRMSSTFVSLTVPARVYDSRGGDGPLGPGQQRAITVTGTFGASTIPSGASAVLTNLTCAGPSGNGFLAMFQDGTTIPATSNVNYRTGVDIANNATSAVSAEGKVRVLCGAGSGATNFIVDVFGYYL
jgi:hypothetical protein